MQEFHNWHILRYYTILACMCYSFTFNNTVIMQSLWAPASSWCCLHSAVSLGDSCPSRSSASFIHAKAGRFKNMRNRSKIVLHLLPWTWFLYIFFIYLFLFIQFSKRNSTHNEVSSFTRRFITWVQDIFGILQPGVFFFFICWCDLFFLLSFIYFKNDSTNTKTGFFLSCSSKISLISPSPRKP